MIKCTGLGNQCKTDEEIEAYFASRYITLLKNEIRFDYSLYGADAIIKESKFETIALGNWQ